MTCRLTPLPGLPHIRYMYEYNIMHHSTYLVHIEDTIRTKEMQLTTCSILKTEHMLKERNHTGRSSQQRWQDLAVSGGERTICLSCMRLIFVSSGRRV